MNRIWISRDSSIPIREQLSAQILFGIVTSRFAPSQRLPSVRDLARRLRVHPNTVSAAYRDLAARGWVKRRTGAGVYVCDLKHQSHESEIDTFVHSWIEDGLSRGFSLEALTAAFGRAATAFRRQLDSRNLLVLHPDGNLARILAAEIEEAVGFTVPYAAMEDARQIRDLETRTILTTSSGAEAVSRLHPASSELIQLKSVEELLVGVEAPGSPVLIGIVSRSETILKWASLLIPALGLPGSEMIARNPGQADWQDGLAACDLIAADVVCARELPGKIHPIVFRLLPDGFLQRARGLVTAQRV